MKKIAIYVEGQREQVLVNHLILTWWSYNGIRIQNIRLAKDQNEINVHKVHDFPGVNPDIYFVIINVEGEGTLASAIAYRSEKQREKDFEIIALRDLYAQDFEQMSLKNEKEPVQKITERFKQALKLMKCKDLETVELFFAIMEIEAWLLAFPKAIAQWAKIDEIDVKKKIKEQNSNIEMIRRPSSLIKQIGEMSNRNKSKSFDASMSFVSSISREDILGVYQSKQVSSFNKFWDKIISL